MGSRTHTTTHADPPQLLTEGKPGYEQGVNFYRGQLDSPNVYEGERFTPPTGLQTNAVQQAQATLGGGGEPGYSSLAKDEAQRTMAGDWLEGPSAQRALTGAAQPLFERFENQTMPGIRDRSSFATRGSGGSRRTVAENNAIQELGQSYGMGVAAPVFNAERERMARMAQEAPGQFTAADLARAGGQMNLGEQERKLLELPVGANRDKFEEWLSRRGASADSLIGAAGMGGGGSQGIYDPSTMRMVLGSGKA